MSAVIVCGGRDFTDRAWLNKVLDGLYADRPHWRCLVHGGATGADIMAEEWAVSRGLNTHCVHASWKAYGRAAGPLRNQLMLDTYPLALVVAFPGGRGTLDMMSRAKQQGRSLLVLIDREGRHMPQRMLL